MYLCNYCYYLYTNCREDLWDKWVKPISKKHKDKGFTWKKAGVGNYWHKIYKILQVCKFSFSWVMFFAKQTTKNAFLARRYLKTVEKNNS